MRLIVVRWIISYKYKQHILLIIRYGHITLLGHKWFRKKMIKIQRHQKWNDIDGLARGEENNEKMLISVNNKLHLQ